MIELRNPANLMKDWRAPGKLVSVILWSFLTLFAGCSRNDTAATTAPATSSSQPAPPFSQGGQSSSSSAPPPAGVTAQQTGDPNWAQLTPAQQHVLAPLAAEWNNLEPFRRKKWLEIAAKYEKMPPAEQQRMQIRMREWAQLTPEQRRIARESYARAKKLRPDQKSEKWEQYRSLPPEEKKKLAAKAEKKKNVVNLPRAHTGVNTAMQAAKPASPVLPSGPASTTTSTSAPAAAPVPAPAPAAPSGSGSDYVGDPLSTPAR